MNEVDSKYIGLLKDILDNGVEKDTRAGRVKSVFGRQLRFDLKKGLPLLTTKKVYTKGVIHELLWFLQRPYNSHGSVNIEYLVRNNVHIWDDDAYRWFKTNIANSIKPRQYLVCLNDDNFGIKPQFEYWIENDLRINDENWLKNITKEEFLDLTIQRVEICGSYMSRYRFGDLGAVYGKQWRSFGENNVDQISKIINTLKTNPDDRRMLCVAFNPSQLEDMALPPCHITFQFYARELKKEERWELYRQKYENEPYDDSYSKPHLDIWGDTRLFIYRGEHDHKLDEENIPRYGLSCIFNMRSNDYFLGNPFNILSYSVLTHIIAKLTNMVPDELIETLGDCHVYKEHFDAVREQLTRNGSDIIPQLVINGKQKTIEDFKYEDFEIKDYYPEPIIKAPLLVG